MIVGLIVVAAVWFALARYVAARYGVRPTSHVDISITIRVDISGFAAAMSAAGAASVRLAEAHERAHQRLAQAMNIERD